jgi:hypothetical protein
MDPIMILVIAPLMLNVLLIIALLMHANQIVSQHKSTEHMLTWVVSAVSMLNVLQDIAIQITCASHHASLLCLLFHLQMDVIVLVVLNVVLPFVTLIHASLAVLPHKLSAHIMMNAIVH